MNRLMCTFVLLAEMAVSSVVLPENAHANAYYDSWHGFKIDIGPDRYVDFYRDGDLIYSTATTLSLDYNQMPLALGTRSHPSYGPALHDNISVYGPNQEDDHLLITEFCVTPTEGEFVEIFNPTSSTIDLSNYYITDATFSSGGNYYYKIVLQNGRGGAAGPGNYWDFNASFPPGSQIDPEEYQTIAFRDTCFHKTYGMHPTYELIDTDPMVPNMIPAEDGSIDDNAGFSSSGEVLILYRWDGSSDLVQDVDYVVWGDKVEAVNKSGVCIDGVDPGVNESCYLNDTPIADQTVVNADGDGDPDPHNSWMSAQRSTPDECDEDAIGGNGIAGHDETSEDMTVCWNCHFQPTPGGPCIPSWYTEHTVYEIQYTADPSGDSPLKDSLVTVHGVASEEDFIDGGFVIAEGPGGPWRGLRVYTLIDTVSRGDSVVVFGVVGEYHGRTEVVPDSIRILAVDRPVPPAFPVEVVDVRSHTTKVDAVPESLEAVLVILDSVVVAQDSVGSGEWTVMSLDGLDTCRVDDPGDPPKYERYEPEVGETLEYLRGILNYSLDKYKISPRDDDDIGINIPPEITLVYRNPYVPRAGDDFAWVLKAVDMNGDIDPDSVTVHYTVTRNDVQIDEQTKLMTYDAAGDSFTVYISGEDLINEDLVEGVITVRDSAGHSTDSYVNGFFAGTTEITTFRENDANGDNVYWGYGVRVRGVATVGTGVFRPQGDGVDIYLQDQAGGVNVFSFIDTSRVMRGDSLVVQGKIWQYHGKLEGISVNKVDPFIINLGPGDEPTPEVLTCDQIETQGEQYEGVLVKVLQVYRDTTGPYWPVPGNNANLRVYDVTDTTTLRIDKDTDIDDQPEPAWPQDITGICNQYDYESPYCQGYQLLPRDTFDFLPGWAPQFIRGDAEADEPFGPGTYDVDLFDGLRIIYWLGGSAPAPPCVEAADAEDDDPPGPLDTDVDIFDGLRVIFWLGASAPTPPPPNLGTGCGTDPTLDAGVCDSYPPCGTGVKRARPAPPVGTAEESKLTVVSGESDVTVTVISAEDLVGFNFVIEYDAEQTTAKFVDNAGLVTENFDVFASGVGEPGVVKVVGVRDIDLADGESKLSAGEHRVARIVFEGKAPVWLKVTNSVMAAEYNRALSHHVVVKAVPRPTEFQLIQNFPNPFNPMTQIRYALPEDCHVKLEIFNVLGQLVGTLVDDHQMAGYQSVAWDGRNGRGDEVGGGIYFYRLRAGDHTQTRRMILLK